MTYEKFSMRVRGGCVMTASEHARHEERAEGVRTEPPVAGVGQLHFKYRVPTVSHYEGKIIFSSIVHVRVPPPG